MTQCVRLDSHNHLHPHAQIGSVVQAAISSVKPLLDEVKCVRSEKAIGDSTNQKLLGVDLGLVLYHPDLDTKSAETYAEL